MVPIADNRAIYSRPHNELNTVDSMKRKSKRKPRSPKRLNTDKLYQRIGEFVVCFQWIESKFREIGWLILDPMKKEWPPMSLRSLSNKELIDKVESLFVDLIARLDVEDRHERIKDFKEIVAGCHELRQYRNTLLHSAFYEVKGGGEVLGMLRSNPKVKTDPTKGDVLFDEEALTDKAVSNHLRKLGQLAFPLGQHYLQLVHWSPFDSSPKRIIVPIHLEDLRRSVRDLKTPARPSSKQNGQGSAKPLDDRDI
jgi:hypothetical protein